MKGGVGFAYEYVSDEVVDRMSMDERMTMCNMSIEGGARVGFILRRDDRRLPRGPAVRASGRGVRPRQGVVEEHGVRRRRYDDRVTIDGALEPIVTWGVNPGQSIGVSGRMPSPNDVAPGERQGVVDALDFMGFAAEARIEATPIDVAFIGSCTNSRLSDLREAAAIVKGHRISSRVRAIVVPGSQGVAKAAVAEGLDQIFREAGFEWRGAGCSMCLGMNPDKLQGAEVCASSSNRSFKGRQGSPTGRTLLMSPAMVAAAALALKWSTCARCWRRRSPRAEPRGRYQPSSPGTHQPPCVKNTSAILPCSSSHRNPAYAS